MSRSAISDTQIEQIKSTFAETGRYDLAAQAAKCARSTAKKYVESRDDFDAIRLEKRVDIIAEITRVQIKILAAMATDSKISDARFAELATSFGILTDKHQLLTGEATERYEHRDTGDARTVISRRIDELAERRRAREATQQTLAARSQ